MIYNSPGMQANCTSVTYYSLVLQYLGPVAPISVNFNHQLTQHHRHDNSNIRATSANSSSVKWVSQLTVQLHTYIYIHT